MKKTVKQLAKKPKNLFLIDSLGAILTAFFLFVILRNFHEYVGMSQTILTYLALIAVFFSIYSATCFLYLKENYILYIRIISIANLLYCVLTTGLLVSYYPVLTTIGIGYFLSEILLICGLVYIELNVVIQLQKKKVMTRKEDENVQ